VPVTFARTARRVDGRVSASEDGVPFALPTVVPLVVLVSAVVANVMVVEAGEDVEVRLRLKEIAALTGRLEGA